MTFDAARMIATRAMKIDASGIRKVFDLAAKLKDPINLSIGQPDFDVPEAIKERAIEAIRAGKNKYTPTQGIGALIEALKRKVRTDIATAARAYATPTGASPGTASPASAATAPSPDAWNDPALLILSGTSAGLMLAMFATLNPGDEVLFLDPYFVMYKHLPTMCGAVPVAVDSYPDFRLHPERLEAAITPRTKLLVLCSPSNPTGITLTREELAATAAIARKHNLLVISDEIYDAFCYQPHISIAPLLPDQCIVLKGYSKTYGMTGWRLGYAAAAGAAKAIVEQMTKLQQYTFVCAPSMVQYAALETVVSGGTSGSADGDGAAVDITPYVHAYQGKRDRVLAGLRGVFEINEPGGAFYVFPKVPGNGGVSGTQFVAKAIERNVLIIPGNVFSSHDTHFRLSYATSDEKLDQGIAILRELGQQLAK